MTTERILVHLDTKEGLEEKTVFTIDISHADSSWTMKESHFDVEGVTKWVTYTNIVHYFHQ